MPVGEAGEVFGVAAPSINRASGTLIEMLPAFPEAKVFPEISPPLTMRSDPAVTIAEPALPESKVATEMRPSSLIDKEPVFTDTVPAAPLLPVSVAEKIPVRKAGVPSIDSVPGTLTATRPAFPP